MVDIWGKTVQCRGTTEGKGPRGRSSLMGLGKSEESSGAGGEQAGGGGIEIRSEKLGAGH